VSETVVSSVTSEASAFRYFLIQPSLSTFLYFVIKLLECCIAFIVDAITHIFTF